MMDSHHDQVMRAIAKAAADPPRRYFAYSTILDRDAFHEWRAQHGYLAFELPKGEPAQAIDMALVYDFPSRWWGGRVAGLAERAGSVVHGVVFEIAGADWPIVQHKEGFVTGMSIEIPVKARLASGEVVDATGYATSPSRRREEGPISERFIDALARGAESAGLPADWIGSIRATH